jgi:hypothetical protein
MYHTKNFKIRKYKKKTQETFIYRLVYSKYAVYE